MPIKYMEIIQMNHCHTRQFIRSFKIFGIALAGLCLATTTIAKEPAESDNAVNELLSQPTESQKQPTPDWDENSQAVYDLMMAQFQNANADYQGSVDTLIKYAKQENDPGLYATAYRATLRTKRYEDAVEMAQAWQGVSDNDLKRFEILALALNQQADVAVAELEKYLASDNATYSAEQFSRVLSSLWYSPGILETIEKIYKAYPDDAYIRLDYINLLRWQGRIDDAAAIIDTALFKDPKNLELIQFKSDIYRYGLRLDKAHQVWKDLLKDYPNDSEYQLAYAEFLYNAYEFKQSQSVLQQIKDRALQPTVKRLIMATHIQLEDYAIAESAIDWESLEPEQQDQIRYQLGRMLLEKSQFELAKKQLTLIEEDSPYALDAAIALGQVYYNDSIESGEQWFDDLKKQHYLTDFDLTNMKVQALEAIDRPRLALELLNAYLEVTPQDRDIRYMRSLIAAENGLETQAIADLKIMHTRNPEDSDVQNALGYTMLSQPDQIDAAMTLIDKALFTQPNSPAVVDSMGWGLYLQGDYQAALPYFRYAYAHYTDGEIIGHYVLGLHKAGYTNEARKLWELENRYPPNQEKLSRFATEVEALLP